MKKALSLILALMLVFSLCAIGAGAAGSATVYVTVVVKGEIQIAAKPVTVSELTVEAALKAAHKEYCPAGEAGFAAGIDPMWNMYMISSLWGVKSTPYVVLNTAPLATGDNLAYTTADTTPVKTGDNIVVSVSDDMAVIAPCVSLVPTVNGDNCTITATSWALDFTTFTYAGTPYASKSVKDGDGNSLGTTDANGAITVPNYGTVIVNDAAAIFLGEKPAAPVVEPAAPVVEPAAPVVEPAAPVVEPAAPVVEPAAPVVEPAAPVVEPAAPVVEPAAPVVEPAAPVVAEPVVIAPAPTTNPVIAPSATGTYTVAAGDCLWTICEAVYGNGAKWGEVWAANANIIENPRMIFVGQVLRMP